MHPDPAFRNQDRDAALERAAAIGFAHLFAATPDGPMVVHAPVVRMDGALAFHVSRANRIAPYLDGSRVLASFVGAEGYVSPNWYPVPGNQVPTWNYDAVEIEGDLKQLDDADLTRSLDLLADAHEARVNPANPWHRAKMDAAIFEQMLRGIVGFAFFPNMIRVTRKLSQNKLQEVRDGVIAGLIDSGNHGLAEAMRG